MEIRFANETDLPAIIDIERHCFPVAEAATEKQFYERFKAFGDCFMVAVDENKVIGFINGCVTDQPILPDELYHDCSLHCPMGQYQTVFGLDVLPAYRQQGVAGELMKTFIKMAKSRQQKGMVLTCKDHLIHYYQKFGFIHQGISSSQHGGASWNDMVLIFNNEEKK